MSPNLKSHINRMRRLRVLQVLYNNRPQELGVGIILQLMRGDEDLKPKAVNIAQSLDYLEQRGFCKIKKSANLWIAKITPEGIDYLGYP